MKLAHVFIEHSTMHLDRTFSYGCDSFTVCRGMRVSCPLLAQRKLSALWSVLKKSVHKRQQLMTLK